MLKLSFSVVLLGIPYLIIRSGLWLWIVTLASISYVVRWIIKKSSDREVIKDKAVLITGCDTGFGHDLAKRLDSLGCVVFAGCLHAHKHGAKSLQEACSQRLHVVSMDVGSDESIQNSLKYVERHCPSTGLWAIVSNAGFNVMGEVEFLGVPLYHKAMNVNFYGAIRVTRAFLYLVRKRRGRVVYMSSGRGRFPFPRDSAYHVTKHCLETFNDSMRLEMLKFGVKVSIIEPGHYGKATACQDDVQFARYKSEIEDMWDRATPEMKKCYGKYYLESMLESQESSMATSAMSTEPVIEVMLDAMFSSRPDARYLVSGSNGWYDKSPTFARVFPFLPTWLSDYILIRWTGCDVFPKK